METANEKRTVFRFPFFYENEKRMKALKIQSKNLLTLKIVVNYLNFVFLIEVKTKSKYRILNSFFNLSKKRNGTLGTRIRNDVFVNVKIRHNFYQSHGNKFTIPLNKKKC